ncbi:MAG TPA: hypothetical protein VHS78_18630 [Candidatus Elarobacter sp.]|jgi:hypothetical protein|nr:hypothetical protein [Candidatus Elarobacter sp.]
MTRAIVAAFIAAIAFAMPRVALAQSEPAPSASPAEQLPEIGRTRATPYACAVLRDLVVPSLAADQRADVKFGELQNRLPDYLQLKADYFGQRTEQKTDGVFLEAQFSHLDVGLTGLLQQLETMRKLLDDPRIASSTDPAVVAQRERLEQLYAAQHARAVLLYAYLQRQSALLNKHLVGWEDPTAIAKINIPKKPEDEYKSRTPQLSAPLGMPVPSGSVAEDKSRVRNWTAAMAYVVGLNEQNVARAVAPLQQSCR